MTDWQMLLRRKTMLPLFGDGIFTQEGLAWKRSRNDLRPFFHHIRYENLEVFRPAIEELLDQLPEEGIVDLQPLFFRYTLDVTTAFLFGHSVHNLQETAAGAAKFALAFDKAQDFIAKRFRLLDLYWLIGGGSFRTACETVHSYVDALIDRLLSEKEKSERNESFVGLLADEVPDRKALRSQIINVLVAGRDTTACLLSWTL